MSYGIEDAVRLVLTGLGDLEIFDPDTQEDLPVDGTGAVTPYLIISVTEAPSSTLGLTRGATVQRRGFVQVTVYAPNRLGRAGARSLADQVRSRFPRLTQLGLATVERPAYTSSPLEDSPYRQVPVTIPWLALVKEEET